MPERSWLELLQMDQGLERFHGFSKAFIKNVDKWKEIYEMQDPQHADFPVEASVMMENL